MTPRKIRQRIVVCTIALAIALPAETILVQAVAEPSAESAARRWASSLSAGDLDAAAALVESYPFLYRKEILRALAPDKRAGVWRRHLAEYLVEHPNLDAAGITSIRAAMALATAEAFSSPSKTLQAQTRIVAEQIETLIGREEARALLYRLGPADGTFASIEPLSHKFANRVRGWVVALAAGGGDCDCSQGFGCDGLGWQCSGGGDGCIVDEEWPACGWFWNQTCDGTCQRVS